MHRPPCIDEFEPTFLDQLLDVVLRLFILPFPPHGEELDFDVGEATLWVSEKLFYGTVKDEGHGCDCDSLVSARVVLFCSFKPANIVVGVRKQMNV